MRRVLVVLLILATAGVASASAECLPMLGVDDPKGDTYLSRTQQPFDAPKIDILRYEIEQTNDTLDLRLTLAQRPGGEQNEYYRYWLGFSFMEKGKRPEYMDVRMGFTSTYDSGRLIGPNSMGNPTLSEFPAEWNGNTMTYRIPLKVLHDALGPSVAFGAPTASADGIDRLQDAQGFGLPRVQDQAYGEDVFKEDFPTLLPCLPPLIAEQAQAPTPEARTPWPTWGLVLLLFVAVALVQGRRRA